MVERPRGAWLLSGVKPRQSVIFTLVQNMESVFTTDILLLEGNARGLCPLKHLLHVFPLLRQTDHLNIVFLTLHVECLI